MFGRRHRAMVTFPRVAQAGRIISDCHGAHLDSPEPAFNSLLGDGDNENEDFDYTQKRYCESLFQMYRLCVNALEDKTHFLSLNCHGDSLIRAVIQNNSFILFSPEGAIS